jgi:pyruvate/2-oxoglutarate dehydrogenase complex dihydrolipoamide acyltransferase (E2) component
MDLIGEYDKKPLSMFRKMLTDTLGIANDRHTIKALIEIDVTETRKAIKTYRRKTGNDLSLFIFITKSIAQAIAENPQVQSMIKGNKIITFKDVDISVSIEKTFQDERIPILHIIRKANEKTIEQIQSEIMTVQEQTVEKALQGQDKQSRIVMFMMKLPKFIRMVFWRFILNNPFNIKKHLGTTGFTAVGMFGKVSGWPISLSHFTVAFVMGGVSRKPTIIKGNIQQREMLTLTIAFDHDTIDGAPASRFTNRLVRLIEKAELIQSDAS